MVSSYFVAAVSALTLFVPSSAAKEFDIKQALTARSVDLGDQTLLQSEKDGDGCAYACSVLHSNFNNTILHHGTEEWVSHRVAYWSTQQASVEPQCFYQPTNAHEVSAAILLARHANCPFAVKSGGHAAFKGSSNAQGGITIDLKKMKQLDVSADRSYVSVGPGNLWYDVYSGLEGKNLAVVGGRVADIGVGGLTLGGGISFFTGKRGWACDNVLAYEMVTSEGDILEVTYESYPDLFWALRGGGNNFGVVTRFDLKAHEQGLMWGGDHYSGPDQRDAVLEAFVHYGQHSPDDRDAALITAIGYSQEYDTYLMASMLEYASERSDYPEIFKSFETIPTNMNTVGTKSLANITREFEANTPTGLRETYWTYTCKLDLELLKFIAEVYIDETHAIEKLTGILPAMALQVLTEPVAEHMTSNGGNPLGVSVGEAPLLVINLSYMWSKEEDDAAILNAAANSIARFTTKAKELNMHHDYLYMNYASQYQDVVGGYGKENQKKLLEIAKKYDQDAVFQKLSPGYFKLTGPPVENVWPGSVKLPEGVANSGKHDEL